MNMSGKNMSDNESQEENEDIVLKSKEKLNEQKKDKRNKNNSILIKLNGILENSNLKK